MVFCSLWLALAESCFHVVELIGGYSRDNLLGAGGLPLYLLVYLMSGRATAQVWKSNACNCCLLLTHGCCTCLNRGSAATPDPLCPSLYGKVVHHLFVPLSKLCCWSWEAVGGLKWPLYRCHSWSAGPLFFAAELLVLLLCFSSSVLCWCWI